MSECVVLITFTKNYAGSNELALVFSHLVVKPLLGVWLLAQDYE